MTNVVGTTDVRTKYLNTVVATPRNTASQSTVFDCGNRVLEEIDVLWPKGTEGLVGLVVLYANVAILPWNQPTGFLIGDGERRKFDVGLQVGGPITFLTKNADGKFAHALFITLKLTELTSPTAGAATQILELT